MALIPPVRWDITSGGIDVRAFLLEKAPVTNAQYAEYLRSTGAMPCEAWLTSRPGSPLMNHPVVGLTFAEAEAYASWKRRRLPTALEWEAAARGPAGRKYPWGDSWGSDCCHSRESGGRGTMPIGSKPAGASPDGVVDLFGNVWEWTAIDPRLPTPDEAQTWVMGGAYNTECKGEGKIPRVAVRMTKGYMYLGFRCAADLGGS
jgi:formylglycine-generating enzyme required for sulfatase activity